MKRSFKEILVLGLAAVLAVIFVITPGETAAKEEGVFVVAGAASVTTLDPASASSSSCIMMFRNLYQGLLRHKFNSAEIEGDLAKSWSVSKDGLVYTFKLRDDIKWHKGFGKVTAHDVKFSIDRIGDPKTRSPFIGDLGMVKEVKVVDDLTVEVHLKNRDVTFLIKCVRPKAIGIVCKKAVEQYGEDFARNPIGSGPFVFESISRDEVVMTANKEYYEGPPKIKKVIYKAIPDVDTQIMALMKGEIDFIWGFPFDKPYNDRIKAAGCNSKGKDVGAFYFVLINPKFGPFGDVRVRRAIAHAINKDEIINNLYIPGAAVRLESHIPKGYWGHTEEGLRRYNFDPQKARELLAEAGYPNGFEVTFDANNNQRELPVSVVIENQLNKVGIKAKLEVLDEAAWSKKVRGGLSQIALYLAARAPDADSPLSSFYHGASCSPGYNLACYNKLDREIEEARGEMDQTKRLKMYHEIQKKLMEDLPNIPLFNYNYVVAYRQNVAGVADRDPIWGIDFYRINFKK